MGWVIFTSKLVIDERKATRMACSANRRLRRPFSTESLEVRLVPSAMSLQADMVQIALSPTATTFPPATVDVLANDSGSNLRITSFSESGLGRVERLVAAGPGGRDLLRYVPGPTFRGGYDGFIYTVADSNGVSATERVSIGYAIEGAVFSWKVEAPAELSTTAGTPLPFRSETGQSRVTISYSGDAGVSVGVLLRWGFAEGAVPGPQFPGKFTNSLVRTDAAFYSFDSGYAWLTGTIAGVNALLSETVYVPERGFSAPGGIGLTVQAHLYSAIGVGLDTQLANVLVRVQNVANAPTALDDEFVVRTSTEPTLLDVLANDVAAGPGGLEIVSVQLAGHSQAVVSIDAASEKISYQPPAGFIGSDILAYTVRNAAGVEALARVEVTVMPPIMAIATSDGRTTRIEVVNAETQGWVTEFEAFPSVGTGDPQVEVADVNGDGMSEILVWQGGTGRMRTFNIYGGLVDDDVMQPFGSRFTGSTDFSVGDLDDDGRSELVFVGSTPRGFELRAMDPDTGRIEMSTLMRGLTGTPLVSVDGTTDQVTVLGRSRGGAVLMAMMDVDSATPNRVISRTLMSDRDVRAIERQNGSITSLTLTSADLDNNGSSEAIVGMTFRRGAVRVMSADSSGRTRMMMNGTAAGARAVLLPGSDLFEAAGMSAGWWNGSSLGMLNDAAAPMIRRRIRGVAMG
jgi:hypothetical protein